MDTFIAARKEATRGLWGWKAWSDEQWRSISLLHGYATTFPRKTFFLVSSTKIDVQNCISNDQRVTAANQE